MSPQPPHRYLKVEPYLEVTNSISMLFTFSEGVVRVIGDPGSGKSAVCQMLDDELKAEGMHPVLFPEPPESLEAFDQSLRQTLKLDQNGSLAEALSLHLGSGNGFMNGKRTILIFDNAESIPEDVFKCLNELIEIGSGSIPCMVFCGTDRLKDVLDSVPNQSLGHKNIANLKIQPMSRQELPAYCQAYMAKVGLDNHELDEAKLDHIFEGSGGLPRRVPELIYEQIDREIGAGTGEREESADKRPLIALDDDEEPDTRGMSVEDREQVLVQFKDQVPWRWQSNGVAVAVVVLFSVVAFGWFYPRQNVDIPTVTIYPPPVFDETEQVQTPPPVAEPVDDPEPLIADAQETVVPQAEPDAVPTDATPAEPDAQVTQDEQLQLVQDEQDEQEPEVQEPEIEEALPEEIADTAPADSVEVAELPQADAELAQTEEAVEAPAPTQPEIPETGPVPATADDNLEIASTEPQQADPVEPAPAPAEESDIVNTDDAGAAAEAPATDTAQSEGLSDDDYIEFINDWLASWESQNPEGYFDYYLPEFEPEDSDLAAWRTDRQAKISAPAFISIDAQAFQVDQSGDGSVMVRFTMDYDSDDYADRTEKEVTLAINQTGNLGIVRERNLDVDIVRLGPRSQQAREAVAAVSTEEEEGLGPDEFDAFMELEGEINAWLSAWQNQDLERYFNQYHDNFMPIYQDSVEAWREERIRNISRPRYIEIEMDDLRVLNSSDQGVLVRFWLSYVSSYYKDMTRKEILLTPASQGGFGITQERNLQVRIIPYYP